MAKRAWVRPRLCDRGDRYAGVDRDHAVAVGEQRIDVEFREFLDIGGKLRDLDQHQRERSEVRRPPDIAVAGQQFGDAGAADQLARKLQVQRRQPQCLIVDHLDRGAAAAERHHRTEGRIVGDPHDQFLGLRPHDHRVDRDAAQLRGGAKLPRPRQNIVHRLPQGARIGEVQTHAADFGFVHDVGRQHLGDHRFVAREIRGCKRNRLLGIAGQERRHDGDGISRKQFPDLQRIEPASARRDDARHHPPRGVHIGHEIRRQARRRFHQRIDRFAIAHEMHEAANGGGLGGEIRDSRGLERGGGRLVLADPNGQHGLRHRFAGARRGEGRHHGVGRFGCGSKRGRHVHHQHGVIGPIGEQNLQGGSVAGGISVADDVNRIRLRPGRRQHCIEFGDGLPGQFRKRAAEIGEAIDCEHPDAAAVGEDGQPARPETD